MKQVTLFNLIKSSLSTITGAVLALGLGSQVALSQRIVNVNPSLNSQSVPPETSIYGVFEPTNGVGVDPQSVNIFLNNQNVTNRSTITNNFFSYRPQQNLPSGANTVRVEFNTANGESRVVSWNFTVNQPTANLNINSVSHNAVNKTLGTDDTFIATINGTPNGQGTILLVKDGETVQEIATQEVSPGVYVATLKVNPNEATREGIVVGRLQGQNQTIYEVASQPFAFSNTATTAAIPPVQEVENGTVAANQSLRPLFTNYRSGDEINTRGFTLQGQTLPNATVDIKVTSALPVLGGLFDVNVGQNTLVNQTVTADNNGFFQIQVPAPSTLTSGLRYDVTAVASKGDETSQPVDLTLVQQ
ncbi:conserved hypothetical protein [Gloeothece citriformis PCC 7424]|uniref:Uncharacterized protein n=1 Tax=Gloeothece citriformis (strain PCC 7424) TaxID=65393 RepID=B7KHD5_GLOC7|nr:hypothetical protein [Gloeothece citriformis]ACK69344.1 conserved hypothetical protein [Gloeothece citriformis PCC 7424]